VPSAVTSTETPAGATPERSETGSSVRSFETKRGRCLVDGRYLRLEESTAGYLRNLYEGYWVDGTRRTRLVFALTFFGFGYPVAVLANAVFGSGPVVDSTTLVVLGGAGGVALAVTAYRRVVRGYTTADRIPLSAVTGASVTRGTKGLTRPRVTVVYDDGGRTRRRAILLPSLFLPDGEERYSQAVRVLGAADVPVRRESDTG
jgi:hypothetical protein